MNSTLPDFSSPQWEFLAALHVVKEPIGIEVIEKIAPLSPTQLLDIMHRLSHEEKTTFIFSTHDLRVMQRAERIVTLRDGGIVSDESVEHATAHSH